MLRLVSGAALLLSAYSTAMAAADEVQINEHTLCRAAIHAAAAESYRLYLPHWNRFRKPRPRVTASS
jgi:hypothetical protein